MASATLGRFIGVSVVLGGLSLVLFVLSDSLYSLLSEPVSFGLYFCSFAVSGLWLVSVVVALIRFRWSGAWTLLGAPLALVSPLLMGFPWVICDGGRNVCI